MKFSRGGLLTALYLASAPSRASGFAFVHRSISTTSSTSCSTNGTSSRLALKFLLTPSLLSAGLKCSRRMSSSLPPSLWETALFGASPTGEEVDPGVVEGTDLRVMKYPAPSLRAKNAEITEEELKDGSISKLAKEMFLVMYAAEGVGLAAPQVGVNKRLMVYNEMGDRTKWLSETILVNPKIVEKSEAKDISAEGCLSFPDMNGDVERSKWIKVEAQNLKGKKMKKKYKGWEARIFQHEYDHLDGVVYIDHLTDEGRQAVQPTLDSLVEEFGEGGEL